MCWNLVSLSIPPHELNFELQVDAKTASDRAPDEVDQRFHIPCRGVAPVDDEVSVDLGNLSPSDPSPFQVGGFDQPSRVVARGIFKDAAGAGQSQRLGAAPPGGVLSHPPGDGLDAFGTQLKLGADDHVARLADKAPPAVRVLHLFNGTGKPCAIAGDQMSPEEHIANFAPTGA